VKLTDHPTTAKTTTTTKKTTATTTGKKLSNEARTILMPFLILYINNFVNPRGCISAW